MGGAEGREESGFAAEDLRLLREGFCVAQEMDTGLGSGALLLGSLPGIGASRVGTQVIIV